MRHTLDRAVKANGTQDTRYQIIKARIANGERLTAMDFWCAFAGWQGGTIHDAIFDFKALTDTDRDRFCGWLVDNISHLTDPRVARDFLQARATAIGL